jgi:hypothetical protein
MTWMEYVDELLAFLKSQIGPGHPLHRRKLYVAAVNKDAKAWLVEGETRTLGCGSYTYRSLHGGLATLWTDP